MDYSKALWIEFGLDAYGWDKEMLPLLYTLNRLGYDTDYHCIGHRLGASGYIQFKEGVSEGKMLALYEVIHEIDRAYGLRRTELKKWMRYNSVSERIDSKWALYFKGFTKKNRVFFVDTLNEYLTKYE